MGKGQILGGISSDVFKGKKKNETREERLSPTSPLSIPPFACIPLDKLISKWSHFSHVRLCATPQTAAHQAPPSLGFSRQEHWSGLPFPSPRHESEKWKWNRSVMSDSSQPHGLQPTRLPHPWDFPGRSTGVGCHCLLHMYPLEELKHLLRERTPPMYLRKSFKKCFNQRDAYLDFGNPFNHFILLSP